MTDGIRIHRNWGYYIDHIRLLQFVQKTLHILPGRETSYQRHTFRHEHWTIIAGRALVTLEGSQILLVPGQKLAVGVGEWHKIKSYSGEELIVLEVQAGQECREDDIERM